MVRKRRGRGGFIKVVYKTHWAGLSEPPWGRDMDRQLSRTHLLRYWAGNPDQHRQINRLYRLMRIGAAQYEFSRTNGELVFGACLRLRPTRGMASPLSRHSAPQASSLWHRGDNGPWWLGKISASTATDAVHLVRVLGDLGPVKLPLRPTMSFAR